MGFSKGARTRLCRRSLILVATCATSLAAAGAAHAATLTVTTTADADNGSCTSSQCTLRDAVRYSSPGDTIVVPAGTYTLTLGQLEVGHNLTINGAGASSVTVSGNNNSRVFFIDYGISVTISGMTITGGNGTGGESSAGGGIYAGGGLTLTDSKVTGNTAQSGGGGIYARSTLSIDGSTISDNTMQADEDGGGIYCDCTTLSIDHSTVSGNHDLAGEGFDAGGGIYLFVYTPGTISAKPLVAAPATALSPGTATISNTTVSGNSVNGAGDGLGGGIYLSLGTLNLTNSTISGNTASTQGGGIDDNGTLNSANNTLANNGAPDGANLAANYTNAGGIENTIVAEPQGGGENCATYSGGLPPSQGHNLEDDSAKSCEFTAAGDISGVSAVLGGLANNGGPTQTMALLAGSPAIDHGATIASITTDQRGGPRPQPPGGAYDIGAYERGAVVDMGIKKIAKPNPAHVGKHLTYELKATNNGPSPDPAFAVTVTDKLPSSVKFHSAKPSQGKCSFSAGTLTCHLGTINKGGSATVKVVVTPKKAGTVTNTGKVSSSAKDPNTANDHSTVKTKVKKAAVKKVVKKRKPKPPPFTG